ncbi:MAG: sulfatase-like hydrolase/transferase [Gemmataceae bacterium]
MLLTVVLVLCAAGKPPNVVLMMADDMGYADLGCYGAKDVKTPHLDRLAAGGTRLTQFYSNGPVCTPTRAGLMTGRWQQRVGLEWAIGPGMKEPGLPAAETCVARMLKDAGYRTGLFGKWHLGYRPEYGPLAHGFERFVGLKSGNIDFWTKRENNGELDWYVGDKLTFEKGYATGLIADRAAAFIGEKDERPFFAYVPFNAVHWPFQPPDKEDAREKGTWTAGDRAGYVKMVEAMDAAVGKVLKAAEGRGETLVIFTNDNGGERYSDNGPLFHHKATLWEGGIRVPCIVRWPGKVAAGKVSEQVGISMDLTATVLAACGVKPARALDGVDLVPLLGGAGVSRTLCWRIDRVNRRQQAVRDGDWKWVNDGGVEVLFDLKADPGERRDRGHLMPGKVAEMRGKYAAWAKEVGAGKPAHVVK